MDHSPGSSLEGMSTRCADLAGILCVAKVRELVPRDSEAGFVHSNRRPLYHVPFCNGFQLDWLVYHRIPKRFFTYAVFHYRFFLELTHSSSHVSFWYYSYGNHSAMRVTCQAKAVMQPSRCLSTSSLSPSGVCLHSFILH